MRVSGLASTGVALLLLLSVAPAASGTGLSMTVTTGTTIYQPARFDLGTGTVGEALASGDLTVEWLSNDDDMAVSVVASDLLCADPTCGAGSAPDAIGSAAVSLIKPGPVGPLDGFRLVATVVGDTGDARESAPLGVSVLVPPVRPGRYTGTLSFAVDPAALESHACVATRASARAEIESPSVPCAVPVAGISAEAIRISSAGDGSAAVVTRFALTVR